MSTPYNPPENTKSYIVYQDMHLLLAEKPSGLLSVPGRGPEKADCFISRVQAEVSDALIVHRLDMETSGLMVLARGPENHKALSVQFQDRLVKKTYTARVAGVPIDREGRVDLPLVKDWPNRPLQKVDHINGKPSVTHWRLLETEGNVSCLELTPETGRSHQLRVHLNAIGHPILGDQLYGTAQSKAGADRLQLHACTLEITHPATGEALRRHSPASF